MNGLRAGLTFEEFAWATLWLEFGRLSLACGWYNPADYYKRKAVRELIRRTEQEVLWTGPYGDKSEWAGMVRGWYAAYQGNTAPDILRRTVNANLANRIAKLESEVGREC